MAIRALILKYGLACGRIALRMRVRVEQNCHANDHCTSKCVHEISIPSTVSLGGEILRGPGSPMAYARRRLPKLRLAPDPVCGERVRRMSGITFRPSFDAFTVNCRRGCISNMF